MSLKVFNPGAQAAPAGGLVERLEAAAQAAVSSGANPPDVAAAVRRLIHSPLVALLVKLTPNPADDAALAVLKALFPAA